MIADHEGVELQNYPRAHPVRPPARGRPAGPGLRGRAVPAQGHDRRRASRTTSRWGRPAMQMNEGLPGLRGERPRARQYRSAQGGPSACSAWRSRRVRRHPSLPVSTKLRQASSRGRAPSRPLHRSVRRDDRGRVGPRPRRGRPDILDPRRAAQGVTAASKLVGQGRRRHLGALRPRDPALIAAGRRWSGASLRSGLAPTLCRSLSGRNRRPRLAVHPRRPHRHRRVVAGPADSPARADSRLRRGFVSTYGPSGPCPVPAPFFGASSVLAIIATAGVLISPPRRRCSCLPRGSCPAGRRSRSSS